MITFTPMITIISITILAFLACDLLRNIVIVNANSFPVGAAEDLIAKVRGIDLLIATPDAVPANKVIGSTFVVVCLRCENGISMLGLTVLYYSIVIMWNMEKSKNE
jgi:hypothetical protein